MHASTVSQTFPSRGIKECEFVFGDDDDDEDLAEDGIDQPTARHGERMTHQRNMIWFNKIGNVKGNKRERSNIYTHVVHWETLRQNTEILAHTIAQ